MSPIHYCRTSPCPICNGTEGGRYVDTATFNATYAYPCDRGIPNNVTARGQHHFEASPNGIIVCRYCGQKI